ncbi:hypothetical protein RJ639_042529 [Escallonia herrerae]|uniref:Fe-S metabolism associated domain-containing protein n=1 Tax=Escallonia herrerae TaxID=1293975 RepID=A0AA88WEB7_9ASTE|nr:hypothetical protein RJ639_042529 [Escallonia herrerae]
MSLKGPCDQEKAIQFADLRGISYCCTPRDRNKIFEMTETLMEVAIYDLLRNPDFWEPWLALTVTESPVRPANVAEKLKFLVREFKSLPEPIDRVKRLLQYAGLLPEFEESGRVEANRVMGCTTQVWLEVRMEVGRVMRFRVDSDSEITKGFCSCLIWMLDGAAPEEVLAVRREDLVEMNVGLPANSRVNTWHNVLISMQRRTRVLVEERER